MKEINADNSNYLKDLKMNKDTDNIKKIKSLFERAEKRINNIYLTVHILYNQNKLTNGLCELRNMVSIAYLLTKQAQEIKENKGVFYNQNYV